LAAGILDALKSDRLAVTKILSRQLFQQRLGRNDADSAKDNLPAQIELQHPTTASSCEVRPPPIISSFPPGDPKCLTIDRGR
jgi:hypothetical protein